MAYRKRFPVRITIGEDFYGVIIEALKGNEVDYAYHVFAEESRTLREKIERYGRHETTENGTKIVRLCFNENEVENFIWQFVAAAKNAAEYRDILDFTDNVVEEYANLAETEV